MRLEIQLKELFDTLKNQPWDHTIYTKEPKFKMLDQSILILDDDAEIGRDENNEPLYATEKGFKYFLSVSCVQDIRDNLKSQKPDYTLDELLVAVDFYYHNDAFICIKN